MDGDSILVHLRFQSPLLCVTQAKSHAGHLGISGSEVPHGFRLLRLQHLLRTTWIPGTRLLPLHRGACTREGDFRTAPPGPSFQAAVFAPARFGRLVNSIKYRCPLRSGGYPDGFPVVRTTIETDLNKTTNRLVTFLPHTSQQPTVFEYETVSISAKKLGFYVQHRTRGIWSRSANHLP